MYRLMREMARTEGAMDKQGLWKFADDANDNDFLAMHKESLPPEMPSYTTPGKDVEMAPTEISNPLDSDAKPLTGIGQTTKREIAMQPRTSQVTLQPVDLSDRNNYLNGTKPFSGDVINGRLASRERQNQQILNDPGSPDWHDLMEQQRLSEEPTPEEVQAEWNELRQKMQEQDTRQPPVSNVRSLAAMNQQSTPPDGRTLSNPHSPGAQQSSYAPHTSEVPPLTNGYIQEQGTADIDFTDPGFDYMAAPATEYADDYALEPDVEHEGTSDDVRDPNVVGYADPVLINDAASWQPISDNDSSEFDTSRDDGVSIEPTRSDDPLDELLVESIKKPEESGSEEGIVGPGVSDFSGTEPRDISAYPPGTIFYDDEGNQIEDPTIYMGFMYDESGNTVVNGNPEDHEHALEELYKDIESEDTVDAAGGEEGAIEEESEPPYSEEEFAGMATDTMDADTLKSYQTALASIGIEGVISPMFSPNIITKGSSASMTIPLEDGRTVTLNTDQLQALSTAMGNKVVSTTTASGDFPYAPVGSSMEYKNFTWGAGADGKNVPQFTEVIHGQNVDGTPVDIYRNLQDGRIWVGGKDGTNHLGPAQGVKPVTHSKAVVPVDGKQVPVANGIGVITKPDGTRVCVDLWSGNIVDLEDMERLGRERGTVVDNSTALHSDVKLDDTAPILRLFRSVEANDDGTYTIHYEVVLDGEAISEVNTEVVSSVDELPRSCLNRRGTPIIGKKCPMSVQEIQDVFDTDDISAYVFDTARLVRSGDSESIVLSTGGENRVTLDSHSVSGRYLYGLLWNKDTDMGVRAKKDGTCVKHIRHADGSMSKQPVAFTPYTGKPSESGEHAISVDAFTPLELGSDTTAAAAAPPETKKEDSVEKGVSEGIDWDAVKYFMMLGIPIGAAIGLAMHMVGGKDSSLIANLLGGAAGGALLGGLGAGTGLLKYTKSDNSNGSTVSNATAQQS